MNGVAATWPPRGEIGRALLSFLRDRLGIAENELSPAHSIDALGVDSVEVHALRHHVAQQCGRELPLSLLMESASLGALIEQADATCHGAPANDGAPRAHDPDRDPESTFATCVNPHLSRTLGHLHLDRLYVRGEGLVLTDSEGREVLDFTSQFGALPFGYNPPEIWRAVDGCRAASLPSFAQPSLLGPAAQLAQRLIACAPRGLQYVTFANSGSEAVEVAIKLCRAATGKLGIVSTRGSFHGKTLGALSATGQAEYQRPFGLPLSDFVTVPYGDAASLERLLAAEARRFAAFLVEPIQGEAGVIIPPLDYLREVREVCRRHDVLLIVDEVQTGLGRSGQMFATPADVEPDVLTVAKALGGGLVPCAACLCREAVYTRDFALKHSSTFAGNALAAVVGSAVLAELSDGSRDLLGQVRRSGERLLAELRALACQYPRLIAEVRGVGLMLALEFSDLNTYSSDSLLSVVATQRKLALLFSSYLLNVHGVRVCHSLNHGNVLRIQPALTVTHEQVARFVAALAEALETFDRAEIGVIYARIAGARSGQPGARRMLARHRARAARPAAVRTFAMLYHPPEASSFAQLDPSFASLPQALQAAFARDVAGIVDPFVTARTRFVSRTGACAEGVFVLQPHTAESLLALDGDRREELFTQSLELARAHAASVVGLGGYTSIVTGGGRELSGRGYALTSGNSLTAIASVRTLQAVCRMRGRAFDEARVAVVGACGSVGRATSFLLARDAGGVHCVGNAAGGAHARKRLAQLIDELCASLLLWADDESIRGGLLLARVRELCAGLPRAAASGPWLRAALQRDGLLTSSLELGTIRDLPLVISAVNKPRPLLGEAELGPNAIVCDVSLPASVAAHVVHARPDVAVVAAGRIAVPNAHDIAPIGLPSGQLYACMAEALLMSWEGIEQDLSLGSALDLTTVLQMECLASKHGLRFV